jgi:pyridinium-3,5-bisthiocarboxylic acid mononucleotide nickel chelatase
MKIAYFDTIAGISGDMALGAFISAGVPLEILREGVRQLGVEGVELEASHVQKNGITAVKLNVVVSETEAPHRHLRDIIGLIDASSLGERIKESAKKIFMEVGKAEAFVHGIPIEKVHFHEVGALDSIVDIVGTAICLDYFRIESVYSSVVKLGSSGFVESDHGKLPVPAPATVEILRGYPTVLTDISYELTTPTGAAIIKALSRGVITNEEITVSQVGYGAGTRDIPRVPNLLRIMIGEIASGEDRDECILIEANIDDMNPEIFPYVIEQFLTAGAKDAFLVPVVMKKGRPGILLSALVGRTKVDEIISIFFRETTTLGVRMQAVERRKLVREERIVETVYGLIRMKVVQQGGSERFIPEYEECKRIAKEKGIPLQEVYRRLMAKFS